MVAGLPQTAMRVVLAAAAVPGAGQAVVGGVERADLEPFVASPFLRALRAVE